MRRSAIQRCTVTGLLAIGMPEGAAERPAESAQWARTSTYRVPLDRFDELGLEAGQSFDGGAIPGIPETEGSNYQRSYIQNLTRDEQSGFGEVTVDRTVNSVNSKFWSLKAFDHAVGRSQVPDGIDLTARLGGEKDFAGRMAALYMSDTAVEGHASGRTGVSAAQDHFVNYLSNNLGLDQETATEGFNQGNVLPAYRPYVYGAAMDYFKGRWFGERYERTVNQDEIERYMEPGSSFSDFQFDDNGNVTSHPNMIRHDVSNSREMSEVFGGRLVSDLTEAGTGLGLEKMRVQRRTASGQYIVEARDASLDSWSIMRNRPEFQTRSHVFGQEELDTMAQQNPAMYQNLVDMDRRGILKNYAREIVQASQVNAGKSVNLDYGNPGGVMDALNMTDRDGNRVTFGGIRDQIRANSPSYMEEGEIAKQSLWELDRQTGGARIKIGDQLYGSAGAMATNFHLDEHHQMVNTLGTRFANALDLSERLESDPENENFQQSLAEEQSLLDASLNEMAQQTSILKQSKGITSDVWGGPSVSHAGVALNEMVVNRGDFLRSIAGLNDDEQERLVDSFNAGTATATADMFPHSDSSIVFPTLKLTAADAVRQREGMEDFYVAPGGNVMHPVVNQLFAKDNDADFQAALPYRGWDTQTPISEEELLSQMRRSTGGENLNALAKANNQLLNLYQGSINKTVHQDVSSNPLFSIERYGEGLRETQENKMNMGPNYNLGQRESMLLKRELVGRAGITGSQRDTLLQSAGKIASEPYQTQLDLEEEPDVSTRFLMSARSNLSQPTLPVLTDRRLAGQASFFDIDNPDSGHNLPGFDQPLRMTRLGDTQKFARYMNSKMATQFMDREDYLERDPEAGDVADNGPGFIREVAVGLLPMNVAGDEGRVGALQNFLGRIREGYSGLSDQEKLEWQFNQEQENEFLNLVAPASGRVGAEDYFFGNKQLDAGDRSLTASTWNAYTALRAARKKTYYGGQDPSGKPDAFTEPPSDDFMTGVDTDDHGHERQWFMRNFSKSGQIIDQNAFQGRGGAEAAVMASARHSHRQAITDQGDASSIAANNAITTQHIQNAVSHTSHLNEMNLLGSDAPLPPEGALQADAPAMQADGSPRLGLDRSAAARCSNSGAQ